MIFWNFPYSEILPTVASLLLRDGEVTLSSRKCPSVCHKSDCQGLQISRCRGTKTHSAVPQFSWPLYGSIQGHGPVLKLKPGHRDLIQAGSSWDHFWKADDYRAWIKVPMWVQLTGEQRTWWGCWTAEKLASLNVWIWNPEDRSLFWICISNSSTLKWLVLKFCMAIDLFLHLLTGWISNWMPAMGTMKSFRRK